MIYRTLAGERASQLGFGAMRLPMAGTSVDVPETIRILRHAIDQGVNYLDTAWVYHDGESEVIVGQALKDGELCPQQQPIREHLIAATEAFAGI